MGCSSLISLGRVLLLARRACGGEGRLFHEWLDAQRISPQAAGLLQNIARDFGSCEALDRFDPSALAALTEGCPRAIAAACQLAARGEIFDFARAEQLVAEHRPDPPAGDEQD